MSISFYFWVNAINSVWWCFSWLLGLLQKSYTDLGNERIWNYIQYIDHQNFKEVSCDLICFSCSICLEEVFVETSYSYLEILVSVEAGTGLFSNTIEIKMEKHKACYMYDMFMGWKSCFCHFWQYVFDGAYWLRYLHSSCHQDESSHEV